MVCLLGLKPVLYVFQFFYILFIIIDLVLGYIYLHVPLYIVCECKVHYGNKKNTPVRLLSSGTFL